MNTLAQEKRARSSPDATSTLPNHNQGTMAQEWRLREDPLIDQPSARDVVSHLKEARAAAEANTLAQQAERRMQNSPGGNKKRKSYQDLQSGRRCKPAVSAASLARACLGTLPETRTEQFPSQALKCCGRGGDGKVGNHGDGPPARDGAAAVALRSAGETGG